MSRMDIQPDIIERAIQVAIDAHRGQTRKGSEIPYITHPIAVGFILARAGASDEIIAAGILHDTVEDTTLTEEDIERQFGSNVARLVAGASEPDKSLSWKERKDHTIDYLKAAPEDVRLLTCADKLHNIRSIRRDMETMGDSLWDRFKRGKPHQEWYYRSVIDSLGTQGTFELLEELRTEVDAVFGSSEA
ncbi:phosphohydrolase [Alicyclobacillus ferrooxydans]|uniref:Phosphohydrolase n=2 Tax=Alicyclobacillus ferrooxydans TaxID=471514 RepID=A0A0P9D7D2_9BACL|nr:phosphohydrolase [Alicyclobacillus ferrooxydans]